MPLSLENNFMKTSIALIALLATGTAYGWDDCKYSKAIDVTLDVANSEQLRIAARAGSLTITGRPGTTEARARGRICASEEEWISESELLTEGGRHASMAVMLPDLDDGWSWGNRYVYLDLDIEVPDGLALDIKDSSGEMEVRGTGALEIKDSSGEIELQDIHGAVTLEDSSGDIELTDIGGDVLVRSDSSGDIHGRNIRGSVRVEKDSSGEIRFSEVTGDFIVERDSSGDIVAEGVGGDFRVLRDGSGEVVSKNVQGEIEVPERG